MMNEVGKFSNVEFEETEKKPIRNVSKVACIHCRKAHARCEPHQRPCPRCIRLDLECVDIHGKKRGRKKRKRDDAKEEDIKKKRRRHSQSDSNASSVSTTPNASMSDNAPSPRNSVVKVILDSNRTPNINLNINSNFNLSLHNTSSYMMNRTPTEFQTKAQHLEISDRDISMSGIEMLQYMNQNFNQSLNLQKATIETNALLMNEYENHHIPTTSMQGTFQDYASLNNEAALKDDTLFESGSLSNDFLPYPSESSDMLHASPNQGNLAMSTSQISNPTFTEVYNQDPFIDIKSQNLSQVAHLSFSSTQLPMQVQHNVQSNNKPILKEIYSSDSFNASIEVPTLLNMQNIEMDESIRNSVNLSNAISYMNHGVSTFGYLFSGVPPGLQKEITTLRSYIDSKQNSFHCNGINDKYEIMDEINKPSYEDLLKEIRKLKRNLSARKNEIQILTCVNESLRHQLLHATKKNDESKAPREFIDSSFSIGSPDTIDLLDVDEKQRPTDLNKLVCHVSSPISSPGESYKGNSLSRSFNELLSLFNSKDKFNSTSMSTLICFPGGRIASCNKSFLEKLGYKSSDLYEDLCRWEDVIAEEYWGEVVKFLSQTLKQVNHKRVFHLTHCGVKHRDGSILHAEIIVGIIGGNRSQIPVFVVSYFRFHDQDIPSFEWDINDFLVNFE